MARPFGFTPNADCFSRDDDDVRFASSRTSPEVGNPAQFRSLQGCRGQDTLGKLRIEAAAQFARRHFELRRVGLGGEYERTQGGHERPD
jgi:hypothetical protein